MNGTVPPSSITIVENRAAPGTPLVTYRAGRLAWRPVPRAVSYVVHRNGRRDAVTTATQARVEQTDGLAEYQVMAIDAQGLESFLSEPVRVLAEDDAIAVQAVMASDSADGEKYIELSTEGETSVTFTVDVPESGVFAIDVRYANGSGPVNSGDKAAIRSLIVDGVRVGSLVMPQRGTGLWSDWGYSSVLRVPLSAGSHTIALVYAAVDRNMNGAVNTAHVEHLRLTRLAER
jgi:hypothetical protein